MRQLASLPFARYPDPAQQSHAEQVPTFLQLPPSYPDERPPDNTALRSPIIVWADDNRDTYLKLRFTGEWPPQSLWNEVPNWEYALDEEDMPGQDETTLRPSDDDRFVADYGFTAADVEQADGQVFPALLSMNDGVDGITVFTSEDDGWDVRQIGVPPHWVCVVEDWLPIEERRPSVSFDDSAVFPLLVRSRLLSRETGAPLTFILEPDGTSRSG